MLPPKIDYFNSDKFKARVEGLLEKKHIPGLAIAITHNDQTASCAFGHAVVDPPVPCTPDTLFDIASASKSMTAASVALLVEDEKYPEVKYDGIMSEILPGDFVMATEEYTKNVTLDDVLGHRTGLPRYVYTLLPFRNTSIFLLIIFFWLDRHDNSYLGVNAKNGPDSAQSVTRNIRNLPTFAPLRAKYQYCNIMYTAAAYLVENKSGMSFAEFLETNFFKPLDMTSSSLQPSRARAKGFGDRMARGNQWEKETQKMVSIDMVEVPEVDGAGSIITSVNDYIKWIRAMIHLQAPVTEQIREEMLRARAVTNNRHKKLPPYSSPPMYGAGLETSYYRGHLRVDHGGGVTGFTTKQFFLPGLRFGGIMMLNSGSTDYADDLIIDELIDELLQVPEAERPDWEAYEYSFLDDDDTAENDQKKIIEELLPEGVTGSEPLTREMESYAGRYWNKGYHDLVVEVKDGKLFIDASDRSFGFTGFLGHVKDQTKFFFRIAESEAWGGLDMACLKAEFKIEGDKVVALGVQFEDALPDDELIWFDKQ